MTKVFRILFCLFVKTAWGRLRVEAERPARRPLISSVVVDEARWRVVGVDRELGTEEMCVRYRRDGSC